MTDITQILGAILLLLVNIAIIIIIPYFRKQYGQEKINEVMAKMSEVERWIDTFVEAAEKLFTKEECEKKKAYVMDQIDNKLKELGIIIDYDSVNAMIESAVFEIKRGLVYPEEEEEETDNRCEKFASDGPNP